MTLALGDFPAGATVQCKWATFALTGESVTRSTDGTLRIYKGNSTTERSSAVGITSVEDFDSTPGVHHLTIDLADNTDAGFYAAGNEYQVVMTGMVIDTKTVNAVIAHFSIERTGGVLSLLKSIINGAGVNVTQLGGSAQTEVAAIKAVTDMLPDAGALTTLQSDLDNLQARVPVALVAGRMDASVGAMAPNVVTAAALAADAVTEIQTGIGGGIDPDVAAIKAVTDLLPEAGALTTIQSDLNNLQTRLPTALVNGRMDAFVGAMGADVITAAAIADGAIATSEASGGSSGSSGTPVYPTPPSTVARGVLITFYRDRGLILEPPRPVRLLRRHATQIVPRARFFDEYGVPLDLTGRTVRYTLKHVATGTLLVNRLVATLDNQATNRGEAYYQIQPAAVAQSLEAWEEWEVDFGLSGTETFPVGTLPQVVRILDDLDSA